MNDQQSLLKYTLQIADNALIIGHRISEWCGHGPILEQDIAITNIALDHLGQARNLYQYAAQQFNSLPIADKSSFFTSVPLQNIIAAGKQIDEDDIAYLRDSWDFRNVLLVEQPNNDWAYTVVRSFFYDTFNFFFYSQLAKSTDATLSAIAEKSLKEVTYHMRWSSEWVVRLGDGTDESKQRTQQALNDLWLFTGELFTPDETDSAMHHHHVGADLALVKAQWQQHIEAIVSEATLNIPSNTWMQTGGKAGNHSEYLGYILTELQFMQRAYPQMEW